MAKITAAKRDEIEKRATEKFGTAAVEQAHQRQQQSVVDANKEYTTLKARQTAENAKLTTEQKVERGLRSAGSTVTGQTTAPAAPTKSPFDTQLSAPASQQTSGPAAPQWQQAQLQGIADSNNQRAKRSLKESAQYVGETGGKSFMAGLEALYNDFIDTAATTPVQSYMDLSQAPKSVREQILNGMTEEEYYAQREAELDEWGRDTRSTEWAEAAAAVNDKYGVDAKSGLGVLGAVVGSGAQMAPSLALGAASPALGYMTTFSMGRSGGVTDALANGASYDVARVAGTLTGAIETGIEMASGGLGGTGIGAVKGFGKEAAEEIAKEVVEEGTSALARKLFQDRGAQVLFTWAQNALGEGAEEFFTTELQAPIKLLYDEAANTGKPAADILREMKAALPDAAYSVLVGAITGAVMGSPNALRAGNPAKVQAQLANELVRKGAMTQAEAFTDGKPSDVVVQMYETAVKGQQLKEQAEAPQPSQQPASEPVKPAVTPQPAEQETALQEAVKPVETEAVAEQPTVQETVQPTRSEAEIAGEYLAEQANQNPPAKTEDRDTQKLADVPANAAVNEAMWDAVEQQNEAKKAADEAREREVQELAEAINPDAAVFRAPDVVANIDGVDVVRSELDAAEVAYDVKNAAEAFNRKVVIVKSLPRNANAAWYNGTIYMAESVFDPNAKRGPLSTLLFHEITHSLRGAKSWDKFKAYALQQLEARPDIREEVETLYRPNEWEEEYVAHYVEQVLFRDQEAVNALARAQRSTAQRILESLKSIAKGFGKKVTAEQRAILKAERMFAKALAQTENPATDGEAMFKLIGNKDGKDIFVSNFPPNTPKDVKAQRAIELVQNVWSKKPITIAVKNANGDTKIVSARFDPRLEERSDLSKMAFGNRKGNSSAKRITTELVDDWYYMAERAAPTWGKAETGKSENPAHDDVQYWYYLNFDFLYREDGVDKPYTMHIDIKEKADGAYFYSFGVDKTKELRPSGLLSEVTTDGGNEILSNNHYAQSPENVNPSASFSLPDTDSQYMAAVESGDMETAQRMVDEAAEAAGYTDQNYHGTPNGTFNTFRNWQYFTPDKAYADVYQQQGASSNGYKKTADAPRTYDVYQRIEKPFDTRNPEARRIFEEEFFGKWGNGAPLSERGLPDWTDGDDLIEFFEENGYDYDGIYLDEGGTGGYGGAVNDRGISVVVRDSNQSKSSDPVTYDDNGNVIPLSQRFNPESRDIRYSLPSNQQGAQGNINLREAAEQRWKRSRIKQGSDWLVQHLVSGQKPLENLSKDAEALVDAARRTGGVTQYIAEEQLVSPDGDIMGAPSYVEMFVEAVPQEQRESFDDYRKHLHNIDRMSLENDMELTVAVDEYNAFINEHPEYENFNDSYLKRIAKEGGDGNLAERYLALRDMVETLKAEKNKPVMAHEVDGKMVPYTAEESAEIIAEYDAQHPEWADIVAEQNAWWDTFNQMWLVETGLVSPQAYAALREKYPNYMPTYRVDGKKGGMSSFGNRFTHNAIKQAKGSTAEALPYYQQYIEQIERVIKMQRRNEIGQYLVEYAMQNPRVAARQGIAITQDAGDITDIVNNEGDLNDVEKAGLKALDNGTYQFSVKVNGENVTLNLSKEMYDAIDWLYHNDHGDTMNAVVKLGRKLMRFSKDAITTYNPLFIVKNFVRDLQTYMTNNNAPVGRAAQYYAKAAAEIARNGEAYQQLKALGGLGEGYYSTDKAYALPDNSALGKAKKVVGAPLRAIAAGSEFVESIPRMATYMALRDKYGNTPEGRRKAALGASDVTTNFARTAPGSKILNAFVMYWNAGVQGVDKTVRQLKSAPLRTLAKAAGMQTLLSALLAWAVKDNPYYDELDDEVKDNYFLIPNIFGDQDANGYSKTFIRLPRSREYGALLGGSVARIIDGLNDGDLGGEDSFEEFSEWLGSVGAGFMPPDIMGNNIFNTFTRIDLFDPESPGETWYGGPIVPQRLQKYSPNEQYDVGTSGLATKVAHGLNWVNDYLPLYPDLSPEKLDDLFDTYGGIWADIAMGLTSPKNKGETAGETVGNALTRAFVDPWVKGFTSDPRYSSGVVDEFYDFLGEAESAANDLNKQLGIPSPLVTPEEAAYKELSKLSSTLSELYAEERAVYAAEGSAAYKDRRSKQIREEINKTIRNYELLYNSIYASAQEDWAEAERIMPLDDIYALAASIDTDKNGYWKNEERQAALDKAKGLTEDEKEFLWLFFGGSDKGSPYD